MIDFKKVYTLVFGKSYPAHILTDLSWQDFVHKVLVDWAGYTEDEAAAALDNYVSDPGVSGLNTIGFSVITGQTEKQFVTLQRLGGGGVWIVKEFTANELEQMVRVLSPHFGNESDVREEEDISLTPIFFMFLFFFLAILAVFGSSFYFFVGNLAAVSGSGVACLAENIACFPARSWFLGSAVGAATFVIFATASYVFYRMVKNGK